MNYQKWKFPIALEIKKNKKEFIKLMIKYYLTKNPCGNWLSLNSQSNLEVKKIYIYLWGKLSLDIQHLLHGTSWIYLSTN